MFQQSLAFDCDSCPLRNNNAVENDSSRSRLYWTLLLICRWSYKCLVKWCLKLETGIATAFSLVSEF